MTLKHICYSVTAHKLWKLYKLWSNARDFVLQTASICGGYYTANTTSALCKTSQESRVMLKLSIYWPTPCSQSRILFTIQYISVKSFSTVIGKTHPHHLLLSQFLIVIIHLKTDIPWIYKTFSVFSGEEILRIPDILWETANKSWRKRSQALGRSEDHVSHTVRMCVCAWERSELGTADECRQVCTLRRQ